VDEDSALVEGSSQGLDLVCLGVHGAGLGAVSTPKGNWRPALPSRASVESTEGPCEGPGSGAVRRRKQFRNTLVKFDHG
jgi:hypothetical protein